MKSLLNIISLLALSLAFFGITLLHADSGPGVTAMWDGIPSSNVHPFWKEGITFGEFFTKVAKANGVKIEMTNKALINRVLSFPPSKHKDWKDIKTIKAIAQSRDLQFSVKPDGSWLFAGSGEKLPPKPVAYPYGGPGIAEQLADSDFQREVEYRLLGTWYLEGYGRTRYFIEFKSGGSTVFTGMENASAPPEPTNEERFYGRVVESSSGSWNWTGGRYLEISGSNSAIDGYWIPEISSGDFILKPKDGFGSNVTLKRYPGGRLSYSVY